MIKYLKHNEIDKKRWDACIKNASNGLIYAYSWYLDALCSEQWDALVTDDYQMVFPLPWRKKVGISYIYTPFFIQQLGAFSSSTITEEEINQFLIAIPSEYRLIELCMNIKNKASTNIFKFVENANYELSLSPEYNAIKNKYSENLRRNLRKADQMKVSVREDDNADDIITLFRNGKGREVRHWKENEYNLLKNLLEVCRRHESLKIYKTYEADETFSGGAVFLISENRSIFIFSAASEVAKKSGAMAKLIDVYIEENAGKLRTLDFEGSNNPGLARFYAGFGSEHYSYQRAVRNDLPFWINFLRNLKK
jgi:hypothetical protein